MDKEQNIVLVGMPGAGKSTTGVLLAKALGREFLDADIYMQHREGSSLQDIIDTRGLVAFRQLEELRMLDLTLQGAVIATGGSVVYSEKAMDHLKAKGRIIYLKVPLTVLENRLSDLTSRGVAIDSDQSLQGLLEERGPLYERFADDVIDCRDMSHDVVVGAIREALS